MLHGGFYGVHVFILGLETSKPAVARAWRLLR
jgi:hypothetical protein